jgi:hypothetical protein
MCLLGLAACSVSASGLAEERLTITIGLEPADESREDIDIVLMAIKHGQPRDGIRE